MTKIFKGGIYLAEIKKIESTATRTGSEYYRVELGVSNQEIRDKKVDIYIFENSFSFSIDDFIKLIGTNDEKEMIEKLFYCNIEKNMKGYPELKDFYMTVDSSKLFYDPRKKVMLAKKIEKEISIKGLI